MRRGTAVVFACAAGVCAAPYALATITASPAQQLQSVSSATLAPPTGLTVARGGLGTCVPAVAFEVDLSWVASSLATGYQNLQDAYFAGVHAQGFLGVTTPKWDAVAGSFFGASRGLFWYAPWLLLALPGFVLLLRRRGWRTRGASEDEPWHQPRSVVRQDRRHHDRHQGERVEGRGITQADDKEARDDRPGRLADVPDRSEDAHGSAEAPCRSEIGDERVGHQRDRGNP